MAGKTVFSTEMRKYKKNRRGRVGGVEVVVAGCYFLSLGSAASSTYALPKERSSLDSSYTANIAGIVV